MFTISMMHFEVVIGWFLNLVLLKGLGGGSLSDNGDIGDLISDYGNSILGYWDIGSQQRPILGQILIGWDKAENAASTRSAIVTSTRCVSNTKYVQIYNALSNKQYPKIYNAAIKQQMPSNKKCHQIPNTLPSGQISPNIKFHQICGVEIFWTHVVEMCFSMPNPNCVSNHQLFCTFCTFYIWCTFCILYFSMPNC